MAFFLGILQINNKKSVALIGKHLNMKRMNNLK